MRRLFLACLLALAAPTLAQTTWYVDLHGTAPGAGTALDPYTSIQYAHDQVTTLALDTLSVAPGVYRENLLISKRVKIDSSGGLEVTTLRAAAAGSLVRCTAPYDAQPAALIGFVLDGSAFPTGKGVHVQAIAESNMSVVQCLITGFTAGRAIEVHRNAELSLNRSTVAGNQYGAFMVQGTYIPLFYISDSILRHNAVDYVGEDINIHPSHSCIPQAVFNFGLGSNNIAADPQLWDPAQGDFHLRPTSPCIDAASPSLPADPDGSQADIGVFPFDPQHGWSTYCTAGTTSNDCQPSIAASGVASAAASNGFTITISDLDGGRTGHIFYGLSGPHAAPWGSGTSYLCVKSPSQRTGTQSSGGTSGQCDGAIALDWCAFVATHPGALGAPFTAGAEVWTQLYFRDPPSPKSTSLSNALQFTICP